MVVVVAVVCLALFWLHGSVSSWQEEEECGEVPGIGSVSCCVVSGTTGVGTIVAIRVGVGDAIVEE